MQLKLSLLTALLASSLSFTAATPVEEGFTQLEQRDADIEVAAASSVAWNLTTHPHKLCIGKSSAGNFYGAASNKKCMNVGGKSIKLWSVADGCKVTATDNLNCKGLIHHKVKLGCHDITFKSIRIEC